MGLMAFLVWGKKGVIIKWAFFEQRDRIFQVIAIVILGFAVGEKSASSCYLLRIPRKFCAESCHCNPHHLPFPPVLITNELGNAQVKSLSSCTKRCTVHKRFILLWGHMGPSCQCSLCGIAYGIAFMCLEQAELSLEWSLCL